MNNQPAQKYILMGTLFMFLAISLGAFGAHGLKELVTGKYLETYKTGVDYHIYHSLALVLLGILQMQLPNFKMHLIYKAFMFGILLFSFNCYIYAITQIKIFAMLVPLGGISFLIGWGVLASLFIRKQQ